MNKGVSNSGYRLYLSSIILLLSLYCSTICHAQFITTIVGGGNYDPEIFLTGPQSVVVDKKGNLFIADGLNYQIRRISTTGALNTIAGVGIYGYSGDNGLAINANVSKPTAMAFDTATSILYFADFYNHVVRTIDGAGIIKTVAGNGGIGNSGDGGLATNATFRNITGLAIDKQGTLYIADSSNHVIRGVDINGMINKVVGTGANGNSGDGGNALLATIGSPMGLAVNANGDIYFTDAAFHIVRKVSSTIITTIGGNGNNTGPLGDGGNSLSACFSFPTAVSVDSIGNVYVSDTYHNRIRKIGTNQIITTYAGDGFADSVLHGRFQGDGSLATQASLNFPFGLAMNKNGQLYIADNRNNCIRRVNKDGTITRINYQKTEVGFIATGIKLTTPSWLSLDASNVLYVADKGNNAVFKIDTLGILRTVAGNGFYGFSGDGLSARDASLASPSGIVIDAGNNLFIADKDNNRIRKVLSSGDIITVAGNGSKAYAGDGGFALFASLNAPEGIAIDAANNLYIADAENHVIRKVVNGIISTIVGIGIKGFNGDSIPATNALLNRPSGIWIDAQNNVYIVDANNFRIRKLNAATGLITTIAGKGIAGYSGDGGIANQASINPNGSIWGDANGNIFFADTYNHVIRKIAANGIISTVIGDGFKDATGEGRYRGDGGAGLNASLNEPSGITLDNFGNLYIADTKNTRVRKSFINSCNTQPLVSFKVTTKNNVSNISWTTTTDASIAYYVVQRSIDSINYITVDSVAPQFGSGGGLYTYADTLNIPSDKLFYRIGYKGFFCPANTFSQTTSTFQTTQQVLTVQDTLYTKDGKLFNPCNEEIVLRGINYSAIDDYYLIKQMNSTNAKFNQIVATGANALRIQWVSDSSIRTNLGKDEVANLKDLDTLLVRCARNQIIPIVTLFDLTYQSNTQNWSAFDNLINSFWLRSDVIRLINKHKRYLIINLANEVGLWKNSTIGQQDALDTFVAHYKLAIRKLRNAGIRVPIMIDAPDFGQNWDIFESLNADGIVGNSILQSDPFKNIVFSVHSYWRFKPNEFDNAGENLVSMKNELDRIQLQKPTFVFGEVANNQSPPSNECKWPLNFTTFLSLLQQRKLGWLSWTWTDDNCASRQMRSYDPQGVQSSNTFYGDSIINSPVYGLKSTSIKAACTFSQQLPTTITCKPIFPLIASTYNFNKTATIQFSTPTDSTIAFYSVMRSTKGVDFITVKNFPTNFSKSSKTYQFIDTLPITNGNIFYRLAITDTICGKAYYSNINLLSVIPCNTYPLDSFYAARLNNASIIINWHPKTDANIQYYELKRSTDSLFYTTLTRVTPKYGISHGSYSYTDNFPTDSGTAYYQLIVFDSSCGTRSLNQLPNGVNPFPAIPCTPAPILKKPVFNNDAANTASISFIVKSSLFIGNYQLQRSFDGRNYIPVFMQTPLPDSPNGSRYFYQDTLPVKQGRVFYRVAFVDTICTALANIVQYSNTDSFTIPCTIAPFVSFTNVCNDFKEIIGFKPYSNSSVPRYTLQRAINNEKFTTLAVFSNTNGNTLTSYTYTDSTLSKFGDTVAVIYYRVMYSDTSFLCRNLPKPIYSDTLAVDPHACNNPPLVIFPNPAINEVTMVNVQPNTTLQVFNLQGKMLLQKKVLFGGNYKLSIKDLPHGVYCIRSVSLWTQGTSTKLVK